MKNMKSLMIKIALLLCSAISIAQNDSVYIAVIKDEMEDKTYYMPSMKMVFINEKLGKGFNLKGDIDNKNGELQLTGLTASVVNIGRCFENSELIILLEDSSKLKFKSWNSFNCEGKCWFDITKDDIIKLSKYKVLKVKFVNGVSFDSYVHEVKEDNDYFIQLFYAVKNNKTKLIKK